MSRLTSSARFIRTITILQGRKTKKAIEIGAALTAFYSDAKTDMVTVNFGKEELDKSVIVHVPSRAEVESIRL